MTLVNHLQKSKKKYKNVKKQQSHKFISDLNGEEIVGRFYEKELQEANKKASS